MPPTPVLPESLRLRPVCIHGSHLRIISRKWPFRLPQKFPVRGIRLTCPHPECVSCPDVPAGKNLHDGMSSDLLPGRILCGQGRNSTPVMCVLWKPRDGLCPPSSDSQDRCSSLQNKDRYKCLPQIKIRPDVRILHYKLQ